MKKVLKESFMETMTFIILYVMGFAVMALIVGIFSLLDYFPVMLGIVILYFLVTLSVNVIIYIKRRISNENHS